MMKENDAASFEVPIFTTIANIVAKKILHLRKLSNFDSYWELPSSTSRYIIRPSNDNVENIPKKIEKKKNTLTLSACISCYMKRQRLVRAGEASFHFGNKLTRWRSVSLTSLISNCIFRAVEQTARQSSGRTILKGTSRPPPRIIPNCACYGAENMRLCGSRSGEIARLFRWFVSRRYTRNFITMLRETFVVDARRSALQEVTPCSYGAR